MTSALSPPPEEQRGGMKRFVERLSEGGGKAITEMRTRSYWRREEKASIYLEREKIQTRT